MTPTDKLREAFEAIRKIVADAQDERDRFAYIASTIRINAQHAGASSEEAEAMVRGHKPFIEWMAKQYETTRKAALAAAPQPDPKRQALVEHDGRVQELGELIFYAAQDGLGDLDSFEAMKIADALLARGLRLPEDEPRINWRGDPDAIVEDDEIDVRGGEGTA